MAFSIVIVRWPMLFSDSSSPIVMATSLTPLIVANVVLLSRQPKWRASEWVYLTAFYMLLLVIATVRGIDSETIGLEGAAMVIVQLCLLFSLGLFAFCREVDDHRRSTYLEALCWAPVIFVAVNIGLHLLGFTAPAAERLVPASANTLGLIGITADRVYFPLAGGVNQFGPISGVALAACGVMFFQRRRRFLSFIGVLASLYALLCVDSRGSLLFGLFAIAIVLLTPSARRRGLGWLAYAIPFVPVLVIVGLAALGNSSVGTNVSRNSGESIASGTGRTFVWKEVRKEAEHPKIEHIFGYGRDGEVPSGVSQGYAWIFAATDKPLQSNAHNLMLQTFLDIGWVGVIVVLFIAGGLLTRLGRRANEPLYAVLLTAVIATLLIGVVEATPDPIRLDMFTFWLLAMLAGFRSFEPSLQVVSVQAKRQAP